MTPPPFPRWQRLVALALPMLVSLGFATVVVLGLQRRQRAADEVRASQRTIALAESIRLRMVDAETGQRGFVITGDERYLEPYRGAHRDVRRALGDLRHATAGAPAARSLVDSVETIVARRLSILDARLAIRREQGFESARAAVASGGGREAMDALRAGLDALVSRERRVLARREAAEAGFSRLLLWIAAVGGLLVAVSVMLTSSIFQRSVRAARFAAEETELANERLQEQAVELEAQTDELQVQAVHLEETVAELEAVQEAMQEQHARLELAHRELEARNRDLGDANRSLAEQTARAEEANQAKAAFLATMSHELRTPLNAVAGYADLLELGVHGEVNPAQREALLRIRRNQRYLLGLIEDILSFARVEAGNIEVDDEPVAVDEMLAGLESVVHPLLASRQLAYHCEPGVPGLSVRGDRERIEQIMLNLLTNAAKFTAPGGEVRVRARPAGTMVELVVEDTGRGIPPERLQDVFQPFVQLQRTPLDGSAQGVGLGLSISRDLARAMGGELSAASEVGRGSRFTVALRACAPLAPLGTPAGDATS